MNQIAHLNEVQVEYQISGNPNHPAILLVHGLGANLSQFEDQHELFNANFQVISVNLRGHGNTKLKRKLTKADMELVKIAEDLLELLDYLKIPEAHYIGNSMGGNVGLEIMKQMPSRLKTLTLFGTTGELRTSTFSLGIIKTIHQLIGNHTRGNLAKATGQTKNSKEKIKRMMEQVHSSTIIHALPILSNFNYLDVIKSSSVPCLIIQGGKDIGINKSIDSTIQCFQARGHFSLQHMPKAGHFANLDNPELFNEIVSTYLSTQQN